jgi:hypothetical protein
VSTPPGAGAGAGAGPGAEPSEQELRAAYEAELSRITSADVMLQAAVSLLNIGGMRLGLASSPGAAPGSGPEPDLEQVGEAIEGVRALLPILERKAPQELRPLRDALSQLQMAFARETGAVAGAEQPAPPSAAPPAAAGAAPAAEPNDPAGAPAQPAAPSAPGAPADPAAGPAVSSGRLWVPGR